MTNAQLPRIGITHGDINGVGYEIILKTFAEPAILEICTPIIYGTAKAYTYHRKALNLTTNANIIASAQEAQEGKVNLVNLSDDELPITLGQPSVDAASVTLLALERATDDLKSGTIDVLVTAPINKSVMQSEKFAFCGHTEYLEQRLKSEQPAANETMHSVIDNDYDDLPPMPPALEVEQQAAAKETLPPAPQDEALMILMNESMRIALVTTHLPLSKVPEAITSDNIVRKLRIFDQSLRRDFGITRPRIAVLSLNPHAGDDGLLGSEEQTIIAPAIAEATKLKVHAYGPYASDGFFGTRAYEHFDGVLAMYHDQGLTAFKALAMSNGVNYTAGLSHVRTSPDHGVAYDIAGKGIADETSLRQAIYTAIDVQRCRDTYDSAHANPLHKLYRERKEDERPFSRQPQMRL